MAPPPKKIRGVFFPVAWVFFWEGAHVFGRKNTEIGRRLWGGGGRSGWMVLEVSEERDGWLNFQRKDGGGGEGIR